MEEKSKVTKKFSTNWNYELIQRDIIRTTPPSTEGKLQLKYNRATFYCSTQEKLENLRVRLDQQKKLKLNRNEKLKSDKTFQIKVEQDKEFKNGDFETIKEIIEDEKNTD
jgi:hypothetical protein